MNKDELILLYAYNRWANARVLAACRKVSPEQLFAPAQASFGSLMGTLAHIYTTERFWRLRLQERISPERLANAADFASLAALITDWQAEEASMQSFVEGLPESSIDQWVDYITTSGKPQGSTLWKALLHVVFHGMQFRAEAGAILGALGHSPGDLDLLYFLRDTDQR